MTKPTARGLQRRNALRLMMGVAFLALGGCCNTKADLADADAAVAHFHAQYNAKDFSGIYAAAHDELKTISSEKDFVDLVSAIHRKLGEHKRSTATGHKVLSTPSRSSVDQVFQSEFAEGKGAESFVWRVENGHAMLAGYHINSPTLILK